MTEQEERVQVVAEYIAANFKVAGGIADGAARDILQHLLDIERDWHSSPLSAVISLTERADRMVAEAILLDDADKKNKKGVEAHMLIRRAKEALSAIGETMPTPGFEDARVRLVAVTYTLLKEIFEIDEPTP